MFMTFGAFDVRSVNILGPTVWLLGVSGALGKGACGSWGVVCVIENISGGIGQIFSDIVDPVITWQFLICIYVYILDTPRALRALSSLWSLGAGNSPEQVRSENHPLRSATSSHPIPKFDPHPHPPTPNSRQLGITESKSSLRVKTWDPRFVNRHLGEASWGPQLVTHRFGSQLGGHDLLTIIWGRQLGGQKSTQKTTTAQSKSRPRSLGVHMELLWGERCAKVDF